MTQLHLAGLSEDQTALVLVDPTDLYGERYSLVVDRALLEAVRQSQGPSSGGQPSVDLSDRPSLPKDSSARTTKNRRSVSEPGRSAEPVAMTPRDIQAALRQGKTAREISQEFGVDPARIERFAAPILAEQFAAVERAAALYLEPAKKAPSALPLIEAVRRNLLEKGVRPVPGDDAWSSYLHAQGEWVIRIDYTHRGKAGRAEWRADFNSNKLSALNRAGANLAWVDPTAPTFDPNDDQGEWDDQTPVAVDDSTSAGRPSRRSRKSGTSPVSPEETAQDVSENAKADTPRAEQPAPPKAQGLLFPLR